MSNVYTAVFAVIHANTTPIMSDNLDSEFVDNAVNHCPSFIRTVKNGECTKIRRGSEECNRCSEILHNFILSIPLTHENIQHGVLTIISDSDFDDGEITLLKRLSKNIAFALTAYDIEESRKVAVEQLVSNLTQFETSADRLRNPLAVILSTIETMDEMGVDNAINIIKEHAKRIKKELDEMREDEIKTYELTKDNL